MYGRKKIRQFMYSDSAVYYLRSRHPNCPRTEHVPATEVLVIGRTVGRLRKQQAEVLASEIEMLLFFILILILLLIVVNQFDIYMKLSG